MCLLCIEIQKERMTKRELENALTELVNSTIDEKLLEHYIELAFAMLEDELNYKIKGL